MASREEQENFAITVKFRNICEMENFRYIALHSEISLCSENLYGRSPPQKTKLCTVSEKKKGICFLLFSFLLL